MEIAHPSSQQTRSKPLTKEAIDAASETGIELEAALQTVLPESPSASSPANAPKNEGGLFHDAKRALARGTDPEEVIRRIAKYREGDKHDALDYARRTVRKAQAELPGRIPERRGEDDPTWANEIEFDP